MNEQSIILVPDIRNEGKTLIITATPDMTRVSSGSTGVVLHDTVGVRGEQPDSPIHSDAGALRGDVPLSIPDMENK